MLMREGAENPMSEEETLELARAMCSLTSVQEALRLFDDLFTRGELQAIGQRLAVARMLFQGGTYQEIAERTGASTATISRVNRALLRGSGGYLRLFEREEQAKRENPLCE